MSQQILVNGLVSGRDHSPRIDISDIDGKIHVQMDAEDAIHLALDIIKMAEATMADALLIRWASKNMPSDKGLQFGASLMVEFREYRAQMEAESRERQIGAEGH
jgi:hypothetical protein